MHDSRCRRSQTSIGVGYRHDARCNPEPVLFCLDHRGDILQQRLRVVDNAVLDGIEDAPGLFDLARFIIQPDSAGAEQDMQSLWLEPTPDNPRRAAIMWGPLVCPATSGRSAAAAMAKNARI